MSPRTALKARGDGAVCVSCFLFRRKSSKKPPPLAVETVAAQLRSYDSVPDCRELSVASSSVSCIAEGPKVTPLHLDIPYVAASALSYSNTLASKERYNTPRNSYGPISEAGKAIVAARKDSMRQEHLAAIAHLNTFAKKRNSQLPSSQSGSDASQAFGKHYSGVTSSPASSLEAQHRISVHCHEPQSAAVPAATMAGNPLAVEPAVSEDPLAMQLAAVPSETNPYLSSGSMYGDGDWLAEGIKSHRNSNQSPSVQHSSHQASGSVHMHSGLQHPEGLQEQQAVLPVNVSSKPILGNSLQHGFRQQQDNSNLQSATESYSSSSPDENAPPGGALQHAPRKHAVMPFSATPADSTAQSPAGFTAVQQYDSGPFQPTSASQQQVSYSRQSSGGHWQHASEQQRAGSVQSGSSQALSPAMQTMLPAASQGYYIAQQSGLQQHSSAVSSSTAAGRSEQAKASLASRESSPDECLVAEGWIVAGTIMMSNRTNGASTQASPRARSDGHALSSAASAHTAQTHSSKNASSADSVTTAVALSQEELAALSEELEVLKEKPRSQMTSHQLAAYLDIKIKLARAANLSRRSSLAKPVEPAAVQVSNLAASGNTRTRPLSANKQSPRSNASSNFRVRASVPARLSPEPPVAARQSLSKVPQENRSKQFGAAGRNVQKAKNAAPAQPRRGAENYPRSEGFDRHVPAYMKATASNKAKDAREAQAKFAAIRSALTEKKWNRA